MTRDDIIRMARAAGLEVNFDIRAVSVEGVHINKELERFAALVAAATLNGLEGTHTCSQLCQRPACVETRKAVIAEREACAKLCETMKWCDEGKFFAHWIRARGDLP
jgi:hypothetical protein